MLGGDMAGKAVQAIEDLGAGRFTRSSAATAMTSQTARSWRGSNAPIADNGYYPWRASRVSSSAGWPTERLTRCCWTLMRERLERWMELADERLRPCGKPAFWMLRKRRSAVAAELLEEAPWGAHCRRPGAGARRRPYAGLDRIGQPDAVGQLPRDARGGARRAASSRCSRQAVDERAACSTPMCRRSRAAWTRRRCSTPG